MKTTQSKAGKGKLLPQHAVEGVVLAEGVSVGTVLTIGTDVEVINKALRERNSTTVTGEFSVKMVDGKIVEISEGSASKRGAFNKPGKPRMRPTTKNRLSWHYRVMMRLAEEVRLAKAREDAMLAEIGEIKARVYERPRPTNPSLQIEPHAEPSAYAPDARARAMLRGVAVAEELLRESGGTFDLEQVRSLLGGVSRQAVDKRVRSKTLFTVPGPNGTRLYPTIQFGGKNNRPVEGIKEIHEAMPNAGPWTILAFLQNEQDELGGIQPIKLLKTGRKEDRERVIMAARQQNVHAA